jgi:hypothetical protein
MAFLLADLATSVSGAQWIVSAYMLMLSALILPANGIRPVAANTARWLVATSPSRFASSPRSTTGSLIRSLTMPLRFHRGLHRGRRIAALLSVAGVLLALSGCAGVTPIGDLLDNPARYDGKTVRVEGEVKESAGGLGLGAYQVRDKTGTLTVVSEKSGPPRSGSKVGVKGRFESLITLGSRSLAVLREESRSTP